MLKVIFVSRGTQLLTRSVPIPQSQFIAAESKLRQSSSSVSLLTFQRLRRFGEAVDHQDQWVCEDAGRPPGQSVGSARQRQRRQDGDGLLRLQHHRVGGAFSSPRNRLDRKFGCGEENLLVTAAAPLSFPFTALLRTSPRWSWRRSKPSRRIRFSSELPLKHWFLSIDPPATNSEQPDKLSSFRSISVIFLFYCVCRSPCLPPCLPLSKHSACWAKADLSRSDPAEVGDAAPVCDKNVGFISSQTKWCHLDVCAVCSVTFAHTRIVYGAWDADKMGQLRPIWDAPTRRLSVGG